MVRTRQDLPGLPEVAASDGHESAKQPQPEQAGSCLDKALSAAHGSPSPSSALGRRWLSDGHVGA